MYEEICESNQADYVAIMADVYLSDEHCYDDSDCAE